jgi:iron complex outermembrane receptor protein
MRKFRMAAVATASVVAIVVAQQALANPAGDVAASAGVADDSTSPSDSIVVTGSRPVSEASAGTKTDTPILETPQSISVISGEEISDLGLQNLNQALRFVAGVTPEQRGAAGEVYDQFKLRGFDAPIYLDGLKLFASASGYAQPQADVSRLDRIEVVKGPASVLYGQSSPGGLVAEESKLPLQRDFYGAVSGTYGNYDLYRVDADVGGLVSPMVAWRVYGSVNGAHDEQTYGTRRRQTLSGAVTLGGETATSFTVLANYSHDPRNGDYSVFPAVGTLIPDAAGKISTHFYGGEPDDYFKRDQASLTYIFRHDFGGGWAFRSSGRYQYVKSSLGIVYTGGYPADAFSAAPSAAPTVFSRYSYATQEQLNDWTFDNQLTGKLDTGPIHHDLLFGVDRQVAHSAELYAFGGGTDINAFDPVYGTMATPRNPYEVLNYSGVGFTDPTFVATQQRQQGVYAQDQVAVGGLRLALSGRQDWARASQADTVQHDKKFTYRVGGLYLLPFGLAPYVSYSTSFEPTAGTILKSDGTMGLARPSTGKQFEAGVKYQVPHTDILITGSWFRITQDGLLIAGPIPNTSIQGGKFRSKGVEVEATAPLPYGFNAKLAFSRQHVKSVDDANPTNLLGVGRGGVSANLEWAPKHGPAEGFAIGGAVRHVDQVAAGTYLDGITRNTPSYTLFDALIRYDLGKVSPRLANVELSLNATNLFDKKYLTSCYTTYGWCWYGNRRTVQGTIGFHW